VAKLFQADLPNSGDGTLRRLVSERYQEVPNTKGRVSKENENVPTMLKILLRSVVSHRDPRKEKATFCELGAFSRQELPES